MKDLFSQRKSCLGAEHGQEKKKKMKQFSKGLPSPHLKPRFGALGSPLFRRAQAAAPAVICRPQVVSNAAKGIITWTQRLAENWRKLLKGRGA